LIVTTLHARHHLWLRCHVGLRAWARNPNARQVFMVTNNKHNSSRGWSATIKQGTLPILPSADERLDVSMLEGWLWDAACAIRGAADAPKFKDFILPLVFYKRLSDVFDDELTGYIEQYGDEEVAWEVVRADHEDALKTGRKPIIRFFMLREYRWEAIRNHPADGHLGEFVTEAMRQVARICSTTSIHAVHIMAARLHCPILVVHDPGRHAHLPIRVCANPLIPIPAGSSNQWLSGFQPRSRPWLYSPRAFHAASASA
jgi:hypothetical protein